MESTIRDLRADEVEVRVGRVTQKGASFLLYKDARCDMNILDETFGMFGWQREHIILNGKEFCKVSIFDGETGEWVSKMDTGTESETEKEKGQSSDAFKRACFNVGIGRELYTSPFIFIPLETELNGQKWKLKKQPNLDVTFMEVTNKKITALEITNMDTGEVVYTFPRKIAKKGNNNAKTDYGLPICDKCGKEILSAGTYNPQQIAELGIKNFGKKLCIDCYRKEKGKQNG